MTFLTKKRLILFGIGLFAWVCAFSFVRINRAAAYVPLSPDPCSVISGCMPAANRSLLENCYSGGPAETTWIAAAGNGSSTSVSVPYNQATTVQLQYFDSGAVCSGSDSVTDSASRVDSASAGIGSVGGIVNTIRGYHYDCRNCPGQFRFASTPPAQSSSFYWQIPAITNSGYYSINVVSRFINLFSSGAARCVPNNAVAANIFDFNSCPTEGAGFTIYVNVQKGNITGQRINSSGGSLLGTSGQVSFDRTAYASCAESGSGTQTGDSFWFDGDATGGSHTGHCLSAQLTISYGGQNWSLTGAYQCNNWNYCSSGNPFSNGSFVPISSMNCTSGGCWHNVTATWFGSPLNTQVWWVYAPPPPGTIQGVKVLTDAAKTQLPSGQGTITLNGGFPTSANPYSYPNIAAATYTVAAPTSINGNTLVGYTLCYNSTGCHSNTPTSGSSVSVNVPAGGYADLWWHYAPPGNVSAKRIYTDGTQLNGTNGNLTLDGSNTQTTDTASWTNQTAGAHTLAAAASITYGGTQYNLKGVYFCTNSCSSPYPSGSFTAWTSSNPVPISVNSGQTSVYWWVYAPPPPSCTLSASPNPVNYNNPVMVTWTITGAFTSASIDHGVGTVTTATGSRSSSNITSNGSIVGTVSNGPVNSSPCSTPVNLTPPSCGPSPISVNTNTPVNFTGTGGNNSYTWTATGSTNPSGTTTGTNQFTTQYTSAAGSPYSVRVDSNSAFAICQVIVTVPPYHPYIRTYGGDVAAGSGLGSTCKSYATAADPAQIHAYNNGSGMGAGAQFAAFALSTIDGFSSASDRPTSSPPPIPPNGLTFSNTSGSPPYFGNFNTAAGATLFCATDYPVPTTGTSPAPLNSAGGTQTDVGLLTDGAYTTGATTINGTTGIANSRKVAIYATGNVVITGNKIYYANADTFGSWLVPDDIPSFYLIVRGANIYIDRSVTQLDGVFIALPNESTGVGGTIYTCTSGSSLFTSATLHTNCNTQLVVNGAFLAKQVKFQRSFGDISNGNIAEVFNFSPELWFRAPAAGPPSSTTTGTTYDSIISLPPVL